VGRLHNRRQQLAVSVSYSHHSNLVIVPAQGVGPLSAAASLKTTGEEEEDGVRYYSKLVEY
jgi:hypothetical protein